MTLFSAAESMSERKLASDRVRKMARVVRTDLATCMPSVAV